MEQTSSTTNSKFNGKTTNTLGKIKDVVESRPYLKEGLQDVIDAEKEIFDQGVKQMTSAAKYMRSNWKIVVPVLAAVGLGIYLFRDQPKKMS